MTLACEGSATQALDATRCGSFDFARRLASLRMTLHSVMGFEPFEIHYEARTALGPGRPFMLRGCGLATDQKAVQRRGPGRVVLGSKPQLATAKKTRELGYWRYRLNQPRIRSRRSMRRSGRPLRERVWLFSGKRTISTSVLPIRRR